MGQFLATLVLLLLFHTEFVLTVCPENCLSCTDQTNCTKCKANKWRTGVSLCFADCSKECLNGECHDDTGYCLNCEQGKYGRTCQEKCSLCQNDHCDLYRCVEGCKSGYFEYQTSNDYYCQTCSNNCKLCDDWNVCRICNDGFYLNAYYYNNKTYVICAKCPNESECSNLCFIPNCHQCMIINNRPMCADCSEGKMINGSSCEQNENQCSQICSTNCDDNSICLGKCKNGRTGERCTERCNEKCLICSKNDRNICELCKGDFYATDCSSACSQSCNIEEGKNTCAFDDGYCLNGCKGNYFGDTCNHICPEGCLDQNCDRSTGTCTEGCNDGNTSDKCSLTTTINQKETSVTTTTATPTTTSTIFTQNQAAEDQTFTIGFFSGIGCSIVIVAFAFMLYFIRRRYLANKAAENNSTNVEIPTYIESANNYESLSHNRTRDTVYSDLGTTE